MAVDKLFWFHCSVLFNFCKPQVIRISAFFFLSPSSRIYSVSIAIECPESKARTVQQMPFSFILFSRCNLLTSKSSRWFISNPRCLASFCSFSHSARNNPQSQDHFVEFPALICVYIVCFFRKQGQVIMTNRDEEIVPYKWETLHDWSVKTSKNYRRNASLVANTVYRWEEHRHEENNLFFKRI